MRRLLPFRFCLLERRNWSGRWLQTWLFKYHSNIECHYIQEWRRRGEIHAIIDHGIEFTVSIAHLLLNFFASCLPDARLCSSRACLYFRCYSWFLDFDQQAIPRGNVPKQFVVEGHNSLLATFCNSPAIAASHCLNVLLEWLAGQVLEPLSQQLTDGSVVPTKQSHERVTLSHQSIDGSVVPTLRPASATLLRHGPPSPPPWWHWWRHTICG